MKMKTITTTVKAAGEAFAELDTIVVVAYVVCIIVVVSLQLFVVVLVNTNHIKYSVVVVVVVLRICRVFKYSANANQTELFKTEMIFTQIEKYLERPGEDLCFKRCPQ